MAGKEALLLLFISKQIALQGRCAAVVLHKHCVAVLPSMEMDVLDELLSTMSAGAAAQQQGLPTTVGNSYVLKLAKSGITHVRPYHPQPGRLHPPAPAITFKLYWTPVC